MKADPEQGKALLEQTTAGISAAKADRLKATVASLELDDGPGAIPPHGTQLSAGTDDGGDWDEGLSPHERNKRMFPGFDDEDKPNTLEQLRRNWTDTNTSVTRDVPPYKAGDTPPSTDESKANFYVHHLDLDPKLAERIKPDDIETLRLLERFRQLDGDGTKALEKRLGDLRERDPELHKAFTQKRLDATSEPAKALWSLSDAELKSAIGKIEAGASRNAAGKFLRDAGKAAQRAARKRYPDPVSILGPTIREKMGVEPSPSEAALAPFKNELRRREKWGDQR